MGKAFAITEDCEGTGGIYFADHDIVAKRRFADEHTAGDIGGLVCRRAPWADALHDRPVPAALMIENGWYFECYGCGARIDLDWLEDQRLPADGVIGSQWSAIFCCDTCKQQFNIRRSAEIATGEAMIARLRAIVSRRFPAATFRESKSPFGFRPYHYTRWHESGAICHEAKISFELPCLKTAPATLRYDAMRYHKVGPFRPHYECAAGDREAFEAYARESTRP